MQADRLRWVLGLGLLAVALAAGAINLSEAVAAGIGPAGLAELSKSQPQYMQDQLEPQLKAMQTGVYRWGFLVQAVVGALAALGLLLGSLALLARSRAWRAWVLGWVYYAILMAPFSAVLGAIYLIPEVARQQGQTVTATDQIIQGLMIAVMQCIFPIALRLLLRLPALRSDALTAHTARPMDRDPTANHPSAAPAVDRSGVLATRSKASPIPLASTDLRDDPWNDPSAT